MIYEIKNLHYTYPAGNEVLKDISFSFNEGEILSILGPNGAGKSTLLNCLAGLNEPTQGEVYLTGKPLKNIPIKDIAKTVGYVQQTHTPAFSYTVLHFVVMGCAANIPLFGKPGAADLEAGYAVLEELGIAHLAEKPYTEISGG
ncbi:MAG: ABC transporter ATP-binding protein, partial [Clostridiales bacterium]